MSWRTQRDNLVTRGLQILEALEGITITIGGTDYVASAGPIRMIPVLVPGGEIEVRTRVFVIRTDVLASPPDEGSTFTADSKSWRVTETSHAPSQLAWRVTAQQPTERP